MKQKFIQQSFVGGINQQVDTTRIADNEYPLLINARNRYDVIEPILGPNLLSDTVFPIGGRYQGCIAAENILVVFVSGQAFFKDWTLPNSHFALIPGFQMSATADLIYAVLVPKSYLNYTREKDNDTDVSNGEVNFLNPIDPSPQGIVVQDGLNQPWFISTTMTARVLQNYSQWTVDGEREYVPVGHQMLFHNGVLYVVSSDRTQIFRSVTGRPLDFMVNITSPNGDKESLEQDGGAQTVSHSVDYDPITAIAPLNSDDGSFYVSTARSSYAVTPDFEELIFGEPTFINRFLFSAGCISPFAIVEMLGDYAFVDFNGLRSFNAILQTKNEGRNTPFSKKLGPILQSIQQDYVAAVNSDNYAIFAVNTIYGRAIIYFDTLLNCFSSIDLYTGVGQIRQFAEIKTSVGKRLFAITEGALYELFAGEEYAGAALYVGDWCSNDPEVDQRPSLLKIVVIDAEEAGTISASSYVDRKFNNVISEPVKLTNSTELTPPITPPFGQQTADTVQTITFDFGRALQGWKIGFFIEWNFKCKISHVSLESSMEANTNSVQTQGRMYSRNKAVLNGE